MTSYSEKLMDPRWQRRRLEVLNREKWTCQVCAATHRSLHVHHLYYFGDPWDALPHDLECLCKDCHVWRTDWDRKFATPRMPTVRLCRLLLGYYLSDGGIRGRCLARDRMVAFLQKHVRRRDVQYTGIVERFIFDPVPVPNDPNWPSLWERRRLDSVCDYLWGCVCRIEASGAGGNGELRAVHLVAVHGAGVGPHLEKYDRDLYGRIHRLLDAYTGECGLCQSPVRHKGRPKEMDDLDRRTT